ncbi:MAG: ParB N-terminal domain-containing protein [bacterium]|jgi:ParB-like chromosome segregation protein Spo0J|nr:ParB N-terminal domain-containing protein [candidate division KSB1 bacterium]MDH7560637.1 ParB N-terminal domain-containing protein [bacterium]
MDIGEDIPRRLVSVSLAEVDLEDLWYQVSYGPAPPALAASLRAVGLINPPTLQRRQDGRWRVVAGFRRCALLKEQGATTISAWCVEEAAPGLVLFLWALCDNLGVRALNVVECAVALLKLRMQFNVPEAELSSRYMPLLNLRASRTLLQRYLSLAALPEPMRQGLAEDRLSQEVALRLVGMSQADASALFAVISQLRLGKNYQRDLVRLAEDVARRESISIQEVLSSPEVQGLLGKTDWSPGQKTEKVLAWMRRRRFPRLAEAERRCHELMRRLRLPGNVRLSSPANFEGAEWQCQVRFGSSEELQAAAQRLQQIGESPTLREMLLLP